MTICQDGERLASSALWLSSDDLYASEAITGLRVTRTACEVLVVEDLQLSIHQHPRPLAAEIWMKVEVGGRVSWGKGQPDWAQYPAVHCYVE